MKCIKTGILFVTALLFGLITSTAGESRYVTVTKTNVVASIAIIAIQEGETGELVSSYGEGAFTQVIKNGLTFPAFFYVGNNTYPATKIAGPASFILTSGGALSSAYMTVKITPATYDVNKTLILPPGTNQVYVGLESSTNLVNWADATNGIYGSPITASFFRIRMGQLAPH